MLIKPLMPRPRPASKLHPGPGRWILNVFEVNIPLKRMTKIPGTSKKISLPRILLLMRHQAGNPHQHSLRKNRIVVLAKKNLDIKAKARIPLPLASTPLLSRKTRIKIRTKKTSPTLSVTLVSRKAIMPTSAPKRSQKTSVSLDDLHIGD